MSTQLLALDMAGLAGLVGFEPTNHGVKDRCLNRLATAQNVGCLGECRVFPHSPIMYNTVTYSASVFSAVFGASFTVVESNPLTGSAILAIRFQCLTFVTPFVM